MNKNDSESSEIKVELRKALGIVGDQDIKTEMKPDEEAFLVELAHLKEIPVKSGTDFKILKDVVKNRLENERLKGERK